MGGGSFSNEKVKLTSFSDGSWCFMIGSWQGRGRGAFENNGTLWPIQQNATFQGLLNCQDGLSVAIKKVFNYYSGCTPAHTECTPAHTVCTPAHIACTPAHTACSPAHTKMLPSPYYMYPSQYCMYPSPYCGLCENKAKLSFAELCNTPP